MINLARLDADGIARWLSGAQVRVDVLKMKVPDEEAELIFLNSRLEIRQAGGLAGIFDGLHARDIIAAAITGRRADAEDDQAQRSQVARSSATPARATKLAAARRPHPVSATRAAKRPALT
jgi:hypothetical protein